ncbi:unnamed protein product [Kluyveromyces dobzhanskii CBS 2104]|uniref:WGS project CCBQ000000000 data, contig 00041 n=1 Tax=Kluyveromyces dobzhanskii CBS 2104 TaxID=1427455 RepID=A0A0A8L063_9SACH|nr:unnamed protein product [Kluyveromyces dobzhanskii CBS 2104]
MSLSQDFQGPSMNQSAEPNDIGCSSSNCAATKLRADTDNLEVIKEQPEEEIPETKTELQEIEENIDSGKGSFEVGSRGSNGGSKSVEVNLNVQADFYTPNSTTSFSKGADTTQETRSRFVTPAVIDENYHIGIDSIPLQNEALIVKNGVKFTMMVVGQSGLGKTTFINNLFGTSLLPTVWEADTSSREIKKTTAIVRHERELVEDGFTLRFTVIDTPGFGDLANNSFSWSPIVNYIDEQYRSYIFQEEQPSRNLLKDNRIHCCLYFINLTRDGLSALDIAAMEEISKRVNLIPVIAKVDGLTTSDLQMYKSNIRETLQKQEIKVCSFLDQNDPNCKTIFDTYPFGIVCSETSVMNNEGKLVRGRKYKWGTVEVENPLHSEFTALRAVLMSKNLVDFTIGCENYYEKCRSHILLSRINQAKKNRSEHLDLTGLDLDNPDQNGLDNYKFYEKFDKKYMNDLIVEWSPEFIHKQWEAKKRLSEIVSSEEKRFKDWKQDLLDKQNLFNNEIEDLHTIVQQYRSECNEMETRVNKQRPRKLSRLGLSSHSESAK